MWSIWLHSIAKLEYWIKKITCVDLENYIKNKRNWCFIVFLWNHGRFFTIFFWNLDYCRVRSCSNRLTRQFVLLSSIHRFAFAFFYTILLFPTSYSLTLLLLNLEIFLINIEITRVFLNQWTIYKIQLKYSYNFSK